MEFYRCDWCKKEIKNNHIKIRHASVKGRTINIDLCEECFNKLFFEYLPIWEKEDEEKRRKIEERKARLKESERIND